MGGKSKKAERTKDNARPSSSSHCAELLGTNIPIFFDFSTAKDSFFGKSEEFGYNIDTNFQMALKKMTKKDSVTKLKALQEFTDLCKNSGADSVKQILPFWPRLYCSLATDVEHRVREAAHYAHAAIVEKVKKNIAPYLKQLAGPWFTSQYDNYPPAASAATLAFEQAFPSTKLNKFITFCQEEILNYIYESLIKHTPQTLSNPKTSKPEEMDVKYQRIVIASLQGYNLYLQKVTSDQIREAEESNKKIVSASKFWEYSKSKVPLIRNSFFNVLTSLCQNGKFLLSSEMKRVTAAIFNDLDDCDPMVMTSAWDAALNALVFLEDCWTYVSLEKQLFPKLNSIIKKCGRNAITIFPSILPLLSRIPLDLIKDKADFYGKLLRNISLLLDGSQITGNTSYSDNKTVAVTFIECLQYITTQQNSDDKLCKSLVSDYLIPTLEKKLSCENSSPLALFSETAKLLHSWHSFHSQGKGNYGELLNLFWNMLSSSCRTMIEQESSTTTISCVLNNQLELIKVLKDYNKYIYKPKKKLKFAEDSCDDDAGTDNEDVPEADAGFKERVLEFAKSMAALYMRNVVASQSNIYISVLSGIVNVFNSRSVLDEFLIVQNETSFYSLFNNSFSKWLEDPNMRSGDIVSLSFSFLQYVSEEEKELILQKFCKDWSKSDLQYDICRSLLLYSKDNCVRSWITSKSFSDHLLMITQNYVAADVEDPTSRDIITIFFKARDERGEFVIGASTASSIMNLLSSSLWVANVKRHVKELAQELIAGLNWENTQSQESFEELTIALFKLSCHKEEDKDLKHACGTALSKVSDNNRPCFLKKLAAAVTEIVFSDSEFPLTNIISRINYFIELSIGCNLRNQSCSNDEIESAVRIIKHFVEETATVSYWRKRIEKCCLVGYESGEKWDLKFIDLRDKQYNPFWLQSESGLPGRLNDLSESLSNEYLDSVLVYFLCFYHKSKVQSSVESDITPEMVTKFAKWNIYVGSLLNLVLSAHPKHYRTVMILEPWNPYVTDDIEPSEFKGIAFDCDILPVKVTEEELVRIKSEISVIQEKFTESKYEEKINTGSLCREILDFTLSVGLLISLCSYYSCTKYCHILKNFTNELKSIGDQLFMNANKVEHIFFYRMCKKLVSQCAEWRMIKETLQELFSRSFVEHNTDLEPEDINKFMSTQIPQSVESRTLLKLLYIMRSKYAFHITEEEWNKIFIYLHKFFERLNFEEKNLEKDLPTFSLLSRITVHLVKAFEKNHLNPLENRLCPEACLAWNEVVKTELANEFFQLWHKLAKKWHDQEVAPELLIAIQNVSEMVTISKEFRLPMGTDNIKLALEYLNYIKSPYIVFQVTSFQLLLRLVPELVKLDTEIFCENLSKLTNDMKEGSYKASSRCDWTCKNLEGVISCNQGIVETLLSDFVIGDCCSVEPFTDSFNYTYSYLLIWYFLLEMCGEAHSTLRFQYGFWLRDQGYSSSLLGSIFKLLPQTVIHGSEVKENCLRHFENYQLPSLKEPITSGRIEQISCFVYRMFLQRLPNIIREWWSQSENKTSTLVDKVTSLYVSPILIASELKSVQQGRDGGFDNMEIKVHPSAREVIATYTIDEVKMDLIMTLPQNFPLGTIKIESSNVVVNNSSRRNWLFHISKYLIHQKGTIGEALIMWKNNLDKKFVGIEECYICASILQGMTFETPRVCCKICKKKFHSHCLYKWFSTSNNSSCPICRNLF